MLSRLSRLLCFFLGHRWVTPNNRESPEGDRCSRCGLRRPTRLVLDEELIEADCISHIP